jgi:hypothetical protein
VVVHADALVCGRFAQKQSANEMQRVLGQRQFLIDIHVGIGQIDRQHRVVVARIGSQQQRLRSVEQKFQVSEIACVSIEKPIGRTDRRTDVAVAVKNREAVAILESAAWSGGGPRGGDVEGNFGNPLGEGVGRRGRLLRQDAASDQWS